MTTLPPRPRYYIGSGSHPLQIGELVTSRRSKAPCKPKVPLRAQNYELHLSFGTLRLRIVTYSLDESWDSSRNNRLTRKRMYPEFMTSFIPRIDQLPMLHWTVSRIHSCLELGLQTFNTRPSWSLIFKLSTHGDIEKSSCPDS